MKFCYGCGHTTGGEPLFCNSCGRSYGVKLCPKLHANPRLAEACSRCGSRDLSLPQPRVPFAWRLLALLAYALSGLALVFLSVSIGQRALDVLIGHSRIYGPLLSIALFLMPGWFLWSLLPIFLRRMIYRALKGLDDAK